MVLDTDFTQHELQLDRPFQISRGTLESTSVTTVRISDGTHTGIGGAAPDSYYGETSETVQSLLPKLLGCVDQIDDIHRLEEVEQTLNATVRNNPAAKAAISIAAHDLVCKQLDVPLYRYWGLSPEQAVPTSYTIGIDSPSAMAEQAAEAVKKGFPILKVKLGTDQDKEIIRAIRDVAPDVRIRVDANEGWTPTEAINMSRFLTQHDIEFLEQPVPSDHPQALQTVYEHVSIPIAADESCRTLSDIPQIADACDIANLKLMKCGGLREAIRMIHTARAHGLEVMLGCMIESNASIAAACHLTPLLDYADLDGSLLLEDDLYDGIPIDRGHIQLAEHEYAGTGATRK